MVLTMARGYRLRQCRTMRLILSILAFTAAGFAGPVFGEASAEVSAVPCRACHADVAAEGYPHFQDAKGEANSCTNCHINAAGHPGSADEQARGQGQAQPIMGFRTESAADRSAVCAGCHQDQHPGTGPAAHGSAGVACSDCHRAHDDGTAAPMPAGFDRIDAASATCVSCHEGVFSRFAFNERHRLAEGSISCVSCHDPHAGVSAKLGGFADHTCSGCHAHTAGPFVFEHAASRVEGCAACHEPHGGPNRFLLTYQQEGELCYSCHAMVPQFHTGFGPGGPPRFGPDTVCTACHASIHGSNFDRNFLR